MSDYIISTGVSSLWGKSNPTVSHCWYGKHNFHRVRRVPPILHIYQSPPTYFKKLCEQLMQAAKVLCELSCQGHQCLRHQETPEFSFVPKYFRLHQSASNFYQLGRKVCRSWFLPPSGSTINPPSFPSDAACFTLCRALQILKTLKILKIYPLWVHHQPGTISFWRLLHPLPRV